jgi:hypothetical protein
MDKILTLHPQGKKGVRIDLDKYELIKANILNLISLYGPMTFTDLLEKMNNELMQNFEGSISWYFISVKLDLEARGILERIPAKKSHLIRLKSVS